MQSRIRGSWKLLAVLALLGGGARAEQSDDPPPIINGQGTRLHGTGVLEHISIPVFSAQYTGTAPSSPVTALVRGRFKCGREDDPGAPDCTAEVLSKTTFNAPFAGTLVSFSITPVEPPRSSTVPRYKVTWSYWGPGGGSGLPLCTTANGLAIAVPHTWSTSGELRDNPSYFTFACVPDGTADNRRSLTSQVGGGGVIAKCIDWGFPPWSESGDPKSEQAAREAHQACVRMATADYCGDGKMNTLDGTPVAVSSMAAAQLDNNGRLRITPLFGDADYNGKDDNPGFHLEAAWGIDPHTQKAGVVCLSRARFISMSVQGACLELDRLGTTPLCENLGLGRLKAEARVVSYSTFADKLFMTFSNSSGSFLTTSDVKKQFLPGASFYATFTLGEDILGEVKGQAPFVDPYIEGMLFAPNLPPEFRTGLVPLYRCPNAGGNRGYYLTAQPASCPLEGYIWAPDTSKPKLKPLYLWRRTDSEPPVYVSSIRLPWPSKYKEYERVGGPMGYIPVPDAYVELTQVASPPPIQSRVP